MNNSKFTNTSVSLSAQSGKLSSHSLSQKREIHVFEIGWGGLVAAAGVLAVVIGGVAYLFRRDTANKVIDALEHGRLEGRLKGSREESERIERNLKSKGL